MKDKLILKDLTEIGLETGASLENISVLSVDKEAMIATWEKLTPENLTEIQIRNGDGVVVANYNDLILVSETSTINPDGSILTHYKLREKDAIEKRVDALEEGQDMQNGAIDDLGSVTSALAETQEV